MKLLYGLFFYFFSGFLLLYGQAPSNCKVIYLEHENASTGDQVCIDIKVKDFQQMLGTQFTLKWDTAMLEFSSFDSFNLPNLNPSNFGASPELLAQGRLPFLWFFVSLDEEGFSLPDDATIFTVCFEVKGPSGSFAPVYFDNTPTITELTGWPGPQSFENYVTIGGGVFIGDFPATSPLVFMSSCSFETSCDSVSLYTAMVSGGAPPYSYNWKLRGNPLSSSPEVLFVGAGRYQLEVTDANQQTLFVELGVGDKALNINSSLTPTLCGQNTGAIDIEVTGGSGSYYYQWSDDSREVSRTDLAAGIYWLTVADQASGCADTRQFEITSDSCGVYQASLIIPKTTIAADGSVCVDVIGEGLQDIKGFDISFSWDSSIVRLDQVELLVLPGEENEVITYDEAGNSFSISRRYEQAVTFEEGSTLFLACFTAVVEGGFSDVTFNAVQTQLLLDNDSTITPDLQNGQIWIRSADSLKILIDAVGANPEDTVCVTVSSENFTDITNLQYALSWDNNIIELQGIEAGIFPAADSSSFISWLVDENQRGVLLFSGYNKDGLTINDRDVHYRLCFVAKRGGVAEITKAPNNYSSEAYNSLLQYVPIEFMAGLVNIGEVPPQAMLHIGQNLGEIGEEICVPFRGEQFEGVRKMELRMQWDTSIIELSTINEGALPTFALSSWDLNHEEKGELSLNWTNDSMPPYFFRQRTLLNLCFLGKAIGISPIQINPDLVFESDNPSPDPMLLEGQIEVVSRDSFLDEIILEIPNLTAAEGQTICVPVYAKNFMDIVGLQYTHHWDTTVLQLDTVELGILPDLNQQNFGFTIGNGNLPISWTYSQLRSGVTLSDSIPLYSLCFTVIGEVGDFSEVRIDGNPVPKEVVRLVNNNLELIGLTVEHGNISISRDFVWPGDTDHNGIANHQDLLNIGLAFGQAGPARIPSNNLDWEPLSATDWADSTPQTLINYKHIDTDGNGQIEAADTLAIVNNWNKTTPWYEAPVDEGIVRFEPQQGAPLFVAAREEVRIGKNTFDVILGTETDPAEEVYGLAFSIFYDYEGVQSDKVYAGFDSTWLGTAGNNLLTIQRNDPTQNRIDIAITRTDGQNMSGNGAIASLHVTIEDIILFEGNDDFIEFRIEGVKVINVMEIERPTVPTPTNMTVINQTTPTFELLDERTVQVYPNPARDLLTIDARGITPERVSVLTPQGKVVIQRPFEKTLRLDDLEAGIYFLRLEVQGQSVIKPFVIIQ